MIDGQEDGQGGRWCAGCQHFHGTLYICPKYSAELRDKITGLGARFRDHLRDPEWVAEQRRRGIPKEAIQIMGAFAGVMPGSGKPS